MLLAEELALIALDPDSGRHALGTRDNLNACLAGLLVAELHLADRPPSKLLDAAEKVVAEAGPKPKAVLLAMTGPAQLLELVAPDRARRKQARRRIDHALDATSLEPIAESVRQVLSDATAAVIAATVTTSVAASSGH